MQCNNWFSTVWRQVTIGFFADLRTLTPCPRDLNLVLRAHVSLVLRNGPGDEIVGSPVTFLKEVSKKPQTKGLMSRAVLCVQQREMTKFCMQFGEREPQWLIFHSTPSSRMI